MWIFVFRGVFEITDIRGGYCERSHWACPADRSQRSQLQDWNRTKSWGGCAGRSKVKNCVVLDKEFIWQPGYKFIKFRIFSQSACEFKITLWERTFHLWCHIYYYKSGNFCNVNIFANFVLTAFKCEHFKMRKYQINTTFIVLPV